MPLMPLIWIYKAQQQKHKTSSRRQDGSQNNKTTKPYENSDTTAESVIKSYRNNSGYSFYKASALGRCLMHEMSKDAKIVEIIKKLSEELSEEIKKDAERTAFLEGYGLTVIRIPNNEVSRNFCGVCDYIDDAIKQSLSQKSKDF